jgi:hypothetical protein
MIINNYNGTGIPPYAYVAGGIGSISMDFKSFRSYVVTHNNTGDFLGPERESFYVNIGENTAFSIKFINLGLSGEDIQLTGDSLFWVVSPPVSGGAIKGESWRIATVADGKISSLGAGSVLLPHNQTAMIYFGPDAVSNSNIQPGGIARALTNLLLVGIIGTKNYGQNLPFISLIAQL